MTNTFTKFSNIHQCISNENHLNFKYKFIAQTCYHCDQQWPRTRIHNSLSKKINYECKILIKRINRRDIRL